MFALDSTAVMIASASATTLAYLAIHRAKRGPFDRTSAFAGGGIAVFLATLAIPAGAELLIAAVRGDPTQLPSNWHTYLALASVIAVGIASDKVISVFKALLAKDRADVVATDLPAIDPNVAISPAEGHPREDLRRDRD